MIGRKYFIRGDGKWVEVTAEEYAAHRASVPSVSKGLGDLVHAVAHPIAKAIDRVAGTNLQNCGGCAKRRAALNRLTSGL